MKGGISFFLVLLLFGTAAAADKIFTDSDLEGYSTSMPADDSDGTANEGLPKWGSATRCYSHPAAPNTRFNNGPDHRPGNRPGNLIIGASHGGCVITEAADTQLTFSSSCGQHSHRICKIFSIRNEAGGRRFSGRINFDGSALEASSLNTGPPFRKPSCDQVAGIPRLYGL